MLLADEGGHTRGTRGITGTRAGVSRVTGRDRGQIPANPRT
jgi:hypothetical protein